MHLFILYKLPVITIHTFLLYFIRHHSGSDTVICLLKVLYYLLWPHSAPKELLQNSASLFFQMAVRLQFSDFQWALILPIGLVVIFPLC